MQKIEKFDLDHELQQAEHNPGVRVSESQGDRVIKVSFAISLLITVCTAAWVIVKLVLDGHFGSAAEQLIAGCLLILAGVTSALAFFFGRRT